MLTCRPARPCRSTSVEGRGSQSPYCPDCRRRRSDILARIRQLRQANTIANEWIEALGPLIIRMKEDLSEKQDGRCSRCGKRRRLYFAQTTDEQPTLVCVDCHEQWTQERRSNVPKRG